MKHIFIINPAAGSRDRTKEYRKTIEKTCSEKGLAFEIFVSAAPGDCEAIARKACQSGEPVRLYACGGDGTLNEVICGAAGYENAAVTVFSGGSGNDFVKIFDQPEAFFCLEKLLDAQEETFDLIRCNHRYSLNICSVGLDARIGTDVSNYKRFPLLSGFRAYALSTVINLFRGISEHYIVDIDGQTIDGEKTMICVCNGRYYGGGFNPVPDADPTDGLLDVLLVEKVSLLQVPGVIGKYKSGKYRQLPKLIRHLKVKELSVHCDKPTPVNLDGELLTAQDIRFSLAGEKLRFFYPKGLTWQNKIPQEV